MPLLDGLLTGLFLQLAIGPVFFFILGITVDTNLTNGLFAILAVTIVDYFYITLSIIGVGKLLQRKKINLVFGILSSLILTLFGALIIYKGIYGITNPDHMSTIIWTPISSFSSCFVLTISSPLTIVFFGSIFSSKAIESGYQKGQLIFFGVGTGAATFLFLTLTIFIVEFFKSDISYTIVQVVNCIVGLVIIYYGMTRLQDFLRKRFHEINHENSS